MPKPLPVSGGGTGSEAKNAGAAATCISTAASPATATATAADALAAFPSCALCGAAGGVAAPPGPCSESAGRMGATSAFLAVFPSASLDAANSASLAAVAALLAFA